MMVCGGSSDRQVRAIAEAVVKQLSKIGKKPLSIEGLSEGLWVLVDFNDIIVHVFYEPLRLHYRLEDLWPNAENIAIPNNFLDSFKHLRDSDDV